MPHSQNGLYSEHGSHVLWEDSERAFYRGWRVSCDGKRSPALFLTTTSHPSPSSVDQFRHEYALRDELDGDWAVRPLDLVREAGRTMLVLEDPGGELIEGLLGAPMEIGSFLRLAIGIAVALGKIHQRGLIHKDIKPATILAHCTTGDVRLTGFGIASRLVRERQSPHAPETLAGTLAYMAPEQTGRMNRSIDSRSDLYAVGVTFYQMLTGDLPFTASEPMEWVHCHLARLPVPPAERRKEIPRALSAIVMKLLAKRAEDRYQTAAGLKHDLSLCQTEWEAQRQIDEFSLGKHDRPDRLLISERLYGRKGEVETLLSAFDRIVKGGAPELILVSGYSGIGKSSVVNELQPVLVPPRGLFASGKFDQYKRDVPYATLAQAFQALVRLLLSKSEAELAPWRATLLQTLGPNAGLIVDLAPELRLLIGEPLPIPELPPQDAQRRFQLVLRTFIGVFARAEHPLALFLDDLQWLDVATLDLLEHLLTRSDLRHLLLIGAYRDNEVNADHPLTRKIVGIKSAGGTISEIRLGPLAPEDILQLLADAVHDEPERLAPLAQLVQEKTAGNPFFTVQFISSLAEEELLTFNHVTGRWSWNLDGIHHKGYTDNVVDLLVGKLIRLPAQTQTALRQLACLGNVSETATLSLVLEMSQEQVEAALWESIRQGLLDQVGASFKFVHDRVQEAAYSLIPEASRTAAHLRIGRLLAARTPPGKREESVFDIVNHLNRAVQLITSEEERDSLAELNLIAGKRAKASTAYASALKYLIAGVQLLGDRGWTRRRDLLFALELARAECESLSGALGAADERLLALSHHAADTVERAALTFLHMDVCTELARSDRAVAVALEYLRHVGVDWSPHPTTDEVRTSYEQIRSQLGTRSIEAVVDLPLMTDPDSLATVDVLTRLVPAALFTDPNLDALAICKAVSLSLERGNCDASCLAYVMLSRIAIPRFADYKTAFRFGQVGIQLVDSRGLTRFQGGTYLFFATWIASWMKHVRTSIDLERRAFEATNRIGDLTYATYACCALNASLLVAGEPLSEAQREAEQGVAFAQKAGFGLHADYMSSQVAMVRMLRGLTSKFGCFDSEQFEELRYEHILANNPSLQLQACFYWVRKVQARYCAGEYKRALEASSEARRLIWTSTAFVEAAEYHFYSALAHAASCDSATEDGRMQHMEALAEHLRHLEMWSENCRENFENRVALVRAELARIEERELDAMRLYENAIQSSRTHGFFNNEALAYERASLFYRAHGFDQFADTYLRNARACYEAWGAHGKVRQLDHLYPALRQEPHLPSAASTITAPAEGLDLATVIRVSQAVSGEMVVEKLLDIVMRSAVEHAGAERALLIVRRGDELQIEAEATTRPNEVTVRLRDEFCDTVAAFPESIVRYVMRTHESVILDDAATATSFVAGPYFFQNHVRSVLCLPLLNQAKLTGILYLENNLAPRVFIAQRIALLKVLASQAAISLENTRLYRDLEDREAKIRRLVDANILGIFIWNLEGAIVEANDALLQMLQYSRDDLVSGDVRWTDLTPPEWRKADECALEAVQTVGSVQPYEKEFFRKDGSRVPVLLGGALFEETRSEGVAFVLDLTERKQAEETLHELEANLAHVNRLNLLGELTASLAHEVKQPIATARNNARAALNFLRMEPPDLNEVREAIGCVVGDADRAGDIIDRIAEQIRKAPPRKQHCDLNWAINEVLGLARLMTSAHAVSVQTRLAPELPPVMGDRVQLQQVVLNLIRNAVEAMGSAATGARELTISTEQGPTGVLVAVRDSGPGIDPEHLERVFESFYTTKPEGTGMGLSVCRSIIGAHGGRLWATANEPRGAIFQFTLPRGDARP